MTTTEEERGLQRARRKAEEAEQEARRMRDRRQRWEAEGMYLTRAEFEAGEPCRVCGQPYNDDLPDLPFIPLMHQTPEQKAERELEETRFRERHPDCRAGRWSVEGSRTLHCFYCCPPIPMSERQIEGLRKILAPRPDPASLVVWELTLTCGHTLRSTAHRDNAGYPSHPFECRECDGEIMGVLTGIRIGPADEVARNEEAAARRQQRTAPGKPKPPSKAAVRRKLRDAEAQVEALTRMIHGDRSLA